ncbi:hypothetical protein B0H66DRAFT_331721 [Apodospora peruviana]|uniref:Uncharacterized protein n=1 Tax=Apodospora peruviana TaxID=516989 RepID=A0AAE0HY07_9PEZI|nr:hypothetical protein B0H66DRAFT_331721 [Apodospora peruviana]
MLITQHHHHHPSSTPKKEFRKGLIHLLVLSTLSCAVLALMVFSGGYHFKHNRLAAGRNSSLVSRLLPFTSLSTITATATTSDTECPSDELSDFHVYNNSTGSGGKQRKTWPRPRFHVLVDARQSSNNVCRTLLSALVQGYPPPILVGYEEAKVKERKNKTGDYEKSVDKIVHEADSFLNATLNALMTTTSTTRTRHEDDRTEDVILFLGKDQWIQMPAEVMVRRYLQQREVVDGRLARQYATSGRYRQGVLFPATKQRNCFAGCRHCGNQTIDGSAAGERFLPESSLPEDIYGHFGRVGKQQLRVVETRYLRPRYLGPGSFMGEARDVERLLKGAMERLDLLKEDQGHVSSDDSDSNRKNEAIRDDVEGYLWSEMFFEQEIERWQGQHGATASPKRRKGVVGGMLEKLGVVTIAHDTASLVEGTSRTEEVDDEAEFGISLDYESRIFQDMAEYTTNSNNITGKPMAEITRDVRFLKFDRPSVARSPSNTAAHLYRDPIKLPPELLLHHPAGSSPFAPTTTVTAGEQGEQMQRDNQERSVTVRWSTVEFATNVVVPRASIPAVLNMGRLTEAGGEVVDELWERMWFRQYGRMLLNEYLHPNRHTLALEAAAGGETWWNSRGGRGGVWTDQGMLQYTFCVDWTDGLSLW